MMNKNGRLLFLTAYAAYSSIYIARLNLTVASPFLQSEGLMTAAQIGIMGGFFFLLYSVGQLINGYWGDIVPPKQMVLTGLLLTAVSNLGIGFFPNPVFIILLWGINGFAQSMLWGPLLRSVSGMFPPNRKSFTASLLVSSVGAGSILGIFIASAAIRYSNLRFAFIVPGAIAFAAFLTVLLFFQPPPSVRNIRKGKHTLASLFTPGFILLLTAAMCHGVLKDNINLWVASYFMDSFSINLVSMSFFVFVVPLLTLVGRLVYPFVYRLFGKNEHRVSIFGLSLAALCMLPLCLNGIPPAAAAVCLGIAAAAVSLVNTSFLTILPMSYQGCGCVSAVVGLMDFATYLGAGISSSFYGILLENHTYTAMFLSWGFISVFAVILLIIAQKRRLV